MIYQYIDFVKHNGYFDYRRNEQSKYWMYESINEHLRNSFYHNHIIEQLLPKTEQSVLPANCSTVISTTYVDSARGRKAFSLSSAYASSTTETINDKKNVSGRDRHRFRLLFRRDHGHPKG